MKRGEDEGERLAASKEATKTPRAVFREYCARNGLRFTPERGIIIDEVYRERTHFDVDELYIRIRKSHPKIKLAKGSVYRTIPHLLRAALLRASLAEDGRVCYEQALGQPHHGHAQCLECGKILEFHDSDLRKVRQEVCDKHGFTMLWHTHVIRGYCAECAKKHGKKRDKRKKGKV